MCRSFIEEYEAAVQFADAMIRYEDLVSDTGKFVSSIAEHLKVKVDPEQIVEQVSLNKRDTSLDVGYDAKTLLHGQHSTFIQSGDWRHILPQSLKRQISYEFADWLTANDYALE